jgi:hypothetical protein
MGFKKEVVLSKVKGEIYPVKDNKGNKGVVVKTPKRTTLRILKGKKNVK